MKLSICVIFHNQINYINRVLNSIYSQNLPFEYEILLGDDNSTDGTWEELNNLSKKNSKIKCYQINSSDFNPDDTIDRSGVNRWNVYQHITGEYFSFIDADDYYIDNNRFVEQIKMLEENPDCSVCSANVALYKEGKQPKYLNLIHGKDQFSNGQTFSARYFLNGFFHNSSCIIRKPAQDYSQLFSPFIFDDYTLTLMHLSEGNIIYYNKPVFAYIQQQNSIYTKYSCYEKYLRSICRTQKSIDAFPQYKTHFQSYFTDTVYYLITTNDETNITENGIELANKMIPRIWNLINKNTFNNKMKCTFIKLSFLFIRCLNKIHRGDYCLIKNIVYKLFIK